MTRKKIVKKIKLEKVEKKKDSSIPFYDASSKIKVKIIGIGGGGGSIISEIATDLKRVDFIAANTDKRALKELSKKTKVIQFGEKMTGGFGTGMNFDLGKEAATAEIDKIKKILEGQDICIFVSCLGGGTGSGAVPVFAKIARDLGSITYGIFTLPFNFEGSRKKEIAMNSLKESRVYLNAVSILPNENIFKIVDKNTPLKEALSVINKNLSESLKGLIETIYNPGLINIDFADLRTVLEEKGKLSYLNSAILDPAKGIDEVIKQVISSPFYSYGINNSSGILFNINCGEKIGLEDVSKISDGISKLAKKNARIIFGISQNQKQEEKIKITLLAVGCEAENIFPKEEKKITEEPIKVFSKNKIKKTKITKKKDNKNNNEKNNSQVDIKVRKNGVETKEEEANLEKEILEKEKKWETPAFLRRNYLDN